MKYEVVIKSEQTASVSDIETNETTNQWKEHNITIKCPIGNKPHQVDGYCFLLGTFF